MKTLQIVVFSIFILFSELYIVKKTGHFLDSELAILTVIGLYLFSALIESKNKFLIIIPLFIALVFSTAGDSIQAILKSQAIAQNQEEIIKTQQSFLSSKTKDVKSYKEQNQRLNTAKSVNQKDAIFKSLIENLNKRTFSLFTDNLKLFLTVFLVFSCQLINIIFAHILGRNIRELVGMLTLYLARKKRGTKQPNNPKTIEKKTEQQTGLGNAKLETEQTGNFKITEQPNNLEVARKSEQPDIYKVAEQTGQFAELFSEQTEHIKESDISKLDEKTNTFETTEQETEHIKQVTEQPNNSKITVLKEYKQKKIEPASEYRLKTQAEQKPDTFKSTEYSKHITGEAEQELNFSSEEQDIFNPTKVKTKQITEQKPKQPDAQNKIKEEANKQNSRAKKQVGRPGKPNKTNKEWYGDWLKEKDDFNGNLSAFCSNHNLKYDSVRVSFRRVERSLRKTAQG